MLSSGVYGVPVELSKAATYVGGRQSTTSVQTSVEVARGKQGQLASAESNKGSGRMRVRFTRFLATFQRS